VTPAQSQRAKALARIGHQALHQGKIFLDDDRQPEVRVRVEVFRGPSGNALDRGAEILNPAIGPHAEAIDQLIRPQSFRGLLEPDLRSGNATGQLLSLSRAHEVLRGLLWCKTNTDTVALFDVSDKAR
jgi:hypothetical protein